MAIRGSACQWTGPPAGGHDRYAASAPHLEAPLPNLLVPIDLRDGEPTEPSLFALSEGRRVAHGAGVTLFAVVLTAARPQAEVHRIARRLGLAGADKVLFCEAPGLDAPPLDVTHGMALLTATERVPPLMVLFPAGGAGRELGAPLAVRLGGAFASAADVEVADSPVALVDSVGRVLLRRWRRDRSAYRRLDPVEMERPVIAILASGGVPQNPGTESVEIEVIECQPAVPPRVVELESVPDEDAPLALARALFVLGPGVGSKALHKLRAAAPPGVAIADMGQASAASLAAATPEVVVCVGTTELSVSPSPSTRVGMILTEGASEDPPRGLTDVVWRARGDVAWDDLAAALPALGRKP
jgi:electron transfer flavoprotein alpha subunit